MQMPQNIFAQRANPQGGPQPMPPVTGPVDPRLAGGTPPVGTPAPYQPGPVAPIGTPAPYRPMPVGGQPPIGYGGAQPAPTPYGQQPGLGMPDIQNALRARLGIQ
jgi:hypothetical protein